MANQGEDQGALAQKVNRLYWESDQSVNRIGEELGLSRSALYQLLDPLPAGLPCPHCNAEMAFPNRTARDRGFVVCPDCGLEEEEEAVQLFWEEAAEGEGAGSEAAAAKERALARIRDLRGKLPDEVPPIPVPGRVIAGVALLGVAAGILLARALKDR